MKKVKDSILNETSSQKNKRYRIRRFFYFILLSPLFLWGLMSLWYGSWPKPVCISLLILFGVSHISMIIIGPVKRVLVFCLLIFLIPLISFFLMQPSHNRQWQPDVAFMPKAEIDGNQIIIHNVRNIDYSSETEFTPRFETRTYDLSQLTSIDFFFANWGLKDVSHAMISFGFGKDQYLCLSIETRKKMGDAYSAIKGFFRQYELIYILGSEKDLIRLRTNFRKDENVYLYRLRLDSIEQARKTFIDILERVNQLHDKPEWYNAMVENCMTSAFRIIKKRAAPGKGKWHWSVLLNAHAARNAYENNVIDTSLPFEELKGLSLINKRAESAGNAPDFSAKIREGIPGID